MRDDAPKHSTRGNASSTGDDRDIDKELENKRRQMSFAEESLLYKWRARALGVMAVLTLVLLVIYFLHIVLPLDCRWLSVEDLDRLERFTATVFAGVISTLAVSHYMKH